MKNNSPHVQYIFNYARPEPRWRRWYRRTIRQLRAFLPQQQHTH